jgi:hypothetical protein
MSVLLPEAHLAPVEIHLVPFEAKELTSASARIEGQQGGHRPAMARDRL